MLTGKRCCHVDSKFDGMIFYEVFAGGAKSTNRALSAPKLSKTSGKQNDTMIQRLAVQVQLNRS